VEERSLHIPIVYLSQDLYRERTWMGHFCSYESHTKYKDNWPPISSHFQVHSQYETLRLLKIQVEKQFMSFILLDTVGDKNELWEW
jgi:hypothetical protein